ncbi:hypothetical protein L1049_017279 [Liquidambar formosana]|uniref:Uncharacterized protein n=1 Tax=Liquidambar formosana TaxID=63359 RepID=A0AAP0S7U8_LIQFO
MRLRQKKLHFSLQKIFHALKDYLWASQVWNYTSIDHRLLNSSPRDIHEWLSEFRTKVGEDKMAMVLTIMWAIWHNQNLVVSERVRKDPQSTARTALRYLVEYVAAQSGEDLSVGFGTVVRDYEGQVVILASKRQNGLFERLTLKPWPSDL